MRKLQPYSGFEALYVIKFKRNLHKLFLGIDKVDFEDFFVNEVIRWVAF